MSVDESVVRFKRSINDDRDIHAFKTYKARFQSVVSIMCLAVVVCYIFISIQEWGLVHTVVTDLCWQLGLHHITATTESTRISLWGTYPTNRVGFPKDLANRVTDMRKHSNSLARYEGNTPWMDMERTSDRHSLEVCLINRLIYLLTNVLSMLCAVHLCLISQL